MEHRYPSKIEVLDKYLYDPKQLHHLLRVEEYLTRYINGESYADCLIPNCADYLIEVKNGKYNLEEARIKADVAIENITKICDKFYEEHEETINLDVEKILDDVQYKIMYEALYGKD
jgi:carboxypeptidase C (cathepsin A)